MVNPYLATLRQKNKTRKNELDYDKLVSCERCVNLGNTAIESGFVPLECTISPDPSYNIETRIHFGGMLPDEQHDYILKLILRPYKDIKNYLNGMFKILSIHFEFNKAGNLHIHCLFVIGSNYDYLKNYIYIQKKYHKLFGRFGCNINSCCHITKLTDFDKWVKYLNKENAYKPVHFEFNNIIDNIQQIIWLS